MKGGGVIYANGVAANNVYIFHFTSVPYTRQEDVESDGSQFESGDLVCNTIYTSPGRNNYFFYVKPCKRQKTENV